MQQTTTPLYVQNTTLCTANNSSTSHIITAQLTGGSHTKRRRRQLRLYNSLDHHQCIATVCLPRDVTWRDTSHSCQTPMCLSRLTPCYYHSVDKFHRHHLTAESTSPTTDAAARYLQHRHTTVMVQSSQHRQATALASRRTHHHTVTAQLTTSAVGHFRRRLHSQS